MNIFYKLGLVIITVAFISSCSNEGCTDYLSSNYDESATEDNGTCAYYYGGRENGQIDVGAEVDLNNEYDIFIDDEYIGRLLHHFPEGLACGNHDAVGGIFTSGSHTIRAVGNGGSEVRESVVYLEPQECNVFLIEDLEIQTVVNSIEGTWVRLPGPSGDRTDLAIGGIPDEPSNRVYMCEKRGSSAAGFYKGIYSENTIIWDAIYGLPDFSVSIVDNELELDCNVCLPTMYQAGTWSGECGPLEGSETDIGEIMFWVESDLGCGAITVTISNLSGEIGSYYSGDEPSCGAVGCANFALPEGSYEFAAECLGYTWSGSVTSTAGECNGIKLTL